MTEVLTIHPDRVTPRLITRAAAILSSGALGVVPTDTGYAIVCSASNRSGVKALHRIKDLSADNTKKPLSVLFSDLSDISQYAQSLPNPVFRVLRRTLPGAYTFILQTNKRLGAATLKGRNTLGIRIPDHPIALALLEELGLPLLATSAKPVDPDFPMLDPLEIPKHCGTDIGLVIDAGPIYPQPSTVVDFTSGELEVLREGKGDIDAL